MVLVWRNAPHEMTEMRIAAKNRRTARPPCVPKLRPTLVASLIIPFGWGRRAQDLLVCCSVCAIRRWPLQNQTPWIRGSSGLLKRMKSEKRRCRKLARKERRESPHSPPNFLENWLWARLSLVFATRGG